MFKEILKLIEKKKRFVITSHVRPDGDAIGSAAALGAYLNRLGKQADVILSDPPPPNLFWLANQLQVQTFDGGIEQRSKIAFADVIFVVDVNTLDRVGALARPIKESNATKVLIDHHLDPENWFDHKAVNVRATSTGELIYQLIHGHRPDQINHDIATALYTAIMTDTGSFRFDSVVADTHRITADLIERGELFPSEIHLKVFDNKAAAALRLLGMSLETLTLAYDDQVGYMSVTQEMIRKTGCHTSETEGFVNMILSIGSVKVGVMFLEIEKGVKMSFRSKGEWAVNKWASRFGGGGHRNASGAFVKDGILEVVQRQVHQLAPESIPQWPKDL